MNTTSFALVYDSFFSKITDDMYMQLNQLDTFRMLQELLLSAIEKFQFPRQDLTDYELFEISDVTTYNGVQSNNIEVEAFIYGGGSFNIKLTHEQINILSVYMIVEWLSQQLASVENVRMKYSGSDFKFTSQAAHMQRILQIKKDYEREGFHLQRLYKRRKRNRYGIMKSTFGEIMFPVEEEPREPIDYEQLINKPSIQSVTLIGNNNFEDLNLSRVDSDDLNDIFTED